MYYISFTAAVKSVSQTPCDHKGSPGTESLLFTTLQLGSVVHIARYSQNKMHHSSICWVYSVHSAGTLKLVHIESRPGKKRLAKNHGS